MKSTPTLIVLALFAGCAHTPTKDFVQGSVRITPPIHQDTTVQCVIIRDGGTQPGRFTDAKGRTFDFYIDHRIGTKTPGGIYLNAYPGERKSVRIRNEAEFRQKLGF
jgi:hypothetical protein